MNLSTSDQLTKVKKVSAFVRGAFQTLMVLVGIATVLKLSVLIFMSNSAVTMTDTNVNVEQAAESSFSYRINLLDIVLTADEVQTPLRVFTGLVLVISFAVYMKILQHLVLLFSGYEKGLIFTSANVNQIRQIGITILCIPVIWSGVDLGFIILDNVSDAGIYMVESYFPFTTALAGIVVLLLSWIMDVGRALYEENELVI